MSRRILASFVAAAMVVGLGACTARPSESGSDGIDLELSDLGEVVRVAVSPDDPLAVAVAGLGRITGPSGAFSSEGELVVHLLDADTPDDSFVTASGPGIDVTFEGTELLSPLTVFFDDPAIDIPEPGGTLPLVLHQPDGSPWEAVALDCTPDGVPYLITDDFSPNLLGSIDIPAFIQGIGEDIQNWFGGGISSRGCEGGGPDWASMALSELVHLCTITNVEQGSGAVRAELQIQSNRQYYQWVRVPEGYDYIWVDGQSDDIRRLIARVSGHDAAHEVLLPPGAWMSVGYRQPSAYSQKDFDVYSDLGSAAFDALGEVFGLLPDQEGLLAIIVFLAGCDDFLISADGTELIKCAVEDAAENLANPDKAFASAMDILGERAYAQSYANKLQSLSTFLNWVGKAVKVVGWYLLGRGLFVHVIDWVRSATTKGLGRFSLSLTAIQSVAVEPTTPPPAAEPQVPAPPPPPPPVSAPASGYVDDGGYVGYAKNSRNPSDPNYYYWHHLAICVSNLNPGTYTLKLSNDGVSNYHTMTLSLPESGCVSTGQQGGTTTQSGVSADWFVIEVVGQFTTPRYQPWS